MNLPTNPVAARILIVDDNPAIHEDFRKILCPEVTQTESNVASIVEELFGVPQTCAQQSFEMESAFQGTEALAKVQTAEREGRPYALAFMDVRMPPGWDGIETVKHIWKEHPQIQVVICTAYSDYSWQQILESLGKTDSLVILKKPFDNVEVLQLAHTLTEKWSLTRKANARMADLDELVRHRTDELLKANRQLQGEIEKRAVIETALRESEERFRKAFEGVAVPVSICSLEESTFLDANQSFLDLCGYPKSTLIGTTPHTLGLIVDRAAYSAIIENLVHGRKVHNTEISLRRKNGELRQTLVSIELLTLGQQRCLLSAFQDITERKSLEGQLRHSQKLEAVGQLAAGVAHDFNNLLTVIHGYASLQLAKATLEADVAKAFTQVKAASERAASLTRQLLAFSRRQIVQRKPLDVGDVIVRTKGMLSRVLGETIRLECDLAPGLPCVNADEANLEQVFMNLAVNARDAMPDGGKLSFSTAPLNLTEDQARSNPDRRPGQFVVIAVQDNGCGMERQVLSRIFEPFFTTKPVGRGTGLGLSTVYGILKQHDGWIEVESQVGVGTTFRIYLPTSEETNDASNAAPLAIDKPVAFCLKKSGEAILVVEDEPVVREFITATLANEGFDVAQATSGPEALRKWNDLPGKIRLLLTDMVMPGGISGTSLAKHLVRRCPELRVVYMSGYSPEAVESGQRLEDGVNFLAKPFTHDRLLEVVRGALT